MADQPKQQSQEMPQQIGSYKISRILSTGVMGRTFMANVEKNFFAIKIFYPEYAAKLDYMSKLKEHQEISHPNLMPYIEISYDNTWQHFVVMHYLEVRPISNKRLYGQGQHAIIDMFCKTADGLALAHKHGHVHGNLKPTNVLVRPEGRGFMPIVADFGVAYIYNEEYFNSASNFPKVFHCMAPETVEKFCAGGQLQGLAPTADVYGLTAVLCETLSGKPLFEGIENRKDLMEAKKTRKYRLLTVNFPVKKLNVKKLNEFINQNLSAESAGRIPDMAAWAKELRACVAPLPDLAQVK
jgi:serine/threonine protein kinase